jgi:hypothetical protein
MSTTRTFNRYAKGVHHQLRQRGQDTLPMPLTARKYINHAVTACRHRNDGFTSIPALHLSLTKGGVLPATAQHAAGLLNLPRAQSLTSPPTPKAWS